MPLERETGVDLVPFQACLFRVAPTALLDSPGTGLSHPTAAEAVL